MKPVDRHRSIALRGLTVCATLIVFLAANEIGYRLYLAVSHTWVSFTPDGLRLIPGGHGRFHGEAVTLDRLGFRNAADGNVSSRPVRILILGDSVAFGMGVGDTNVFTHRLNARFAPALGFINMGQPGWDTGDLRDLLYQRGGDLAPQAVVWIYYVNDAKASYHYWLPGRKAETRGWFDRLEWGVYRLLHLPFIMKPVMTYLLSLAHLWPHSPPGPGWPAYYHWCLDAYQPRTITSITEARFLNDVIDWTRRHHCRLCLVAAPARDQLIDGLTAPQQFVKGIMQSAGVPVVDLLPILRAAETTGPVFLPKDPAHLNARGHRILADTIAQWIETKLEVAGPSDSAAALTRAKDAPVPPQTQP